MYILGKSKIRGEEKEILLKEEGQLFKYYSLELMGAYAPMVEQEKIVFKKDSNILEEEKTSIIQCINEKVTQEMLEKPNLLEVIGKIEIAGKETELLVRGEGKIVKYYWLNLIGVYSPKIPSQAIIFKQDTIENKVSAETKEDEQKNAISPTEKEQIEQFLERIKIKDILQKLQLQQSKEERSQYNRTIRENKPEQVQQKQKQSQKKEKESLQIQQKQPVKERANKKGDISIKQEVDMNTRVTDMSNLGQVLQKNKKMPKLEPGDQPLKMGIVESDDLDQLKDEKGRKEQGHTSRYEAVMITKKGKVQALDLENDTQEGTNPQEKNYQVKQNSSVQKADVLTRLKVGQGTIGIEKGQYGEVEVYHSPKKTIGGKRYRRK